MEFAIKTYFWQPGTDLTDNLVSEPNRCRRRPSLTHTHRLLPSLSNEMQITDYSSTNFIFHPTFSENRLYLFAMRVIGKQGMVQL